MSAVGSVNSAPILHQFGTMPIRYGADSGPADEHMEIMPAMKFGAPDKISWPENRSDKLRPIDHEAIRDAGPKSYIAKFFRLCNLPYNRRELPGSAGQKLAGTTLSIPQI